MSEVNNKTLQNSMKAVYEIKQPVLPIIDKDSNAGVNLRVIHTVFTESKKEVLIERTNTRSNNKEAQIIIEREEQNSQEAWIRTPHKNCMGVKYETKKPDILTTELEATIDTFSRQAPPFHIDNFGDSSTLIVDGTKDFNRETFIRFELPLWFLPVVSIGTRLRLYYRGEIYETDSLKIHRNSSEWGEYSLTYANSPNKSGFVTKEFEINKAERYIEFDITELVEEWKLFPETNFGINISSAHERKLSFYSRESHKPPLLIGTFYDPEIKSLGRATKETVIEVIQVNEDDVLVEIEPLPYYQTIDKEVQLKTYEKDGFVPNDTGVEITIIKPQNHVELGVYELKESDTNVIIGNKKSLTSNKFATISVIRNDIDISLEVPNSDSKLVEIEVYERTDKEVEIDIVHGISQEVEIETISTNSIEASITSTKRTKQAQIKVIEVAQDDVDAQLQVKGWEKSNSITQITVTRPDAMVELMAHKSIEDREVELYVNDTVDKEAIIEAIASSSKNVSLNIVEVNDTNAQITVTKVKTNAQIGVYFEQDSEPIVEITPIMKRTSNRQVNISVKGDNVGYAFIM